MNDSFMTSDAVNDSFMTSGGGPGTEATVSVVNESSGTAPGAGR
jgi:hypothetical protein